MADSVLVTANEPFLNKPSSKWTEVEALQVLNNSPWAHTITKTTQDTPCDYEHPACPGLFPDEMAQILNQRVFETTFIVNSTDLFDVRSYTPLIGWMNPHLVRFPDLQGISGARLTSSLATQDAPAAEAASALSTWPLQSSCSQ